MILKPGFETTIGDSSYRVAAILHTDRGGYREVYRAHRYDHAASQAQEVCMIVYAVEQISDRCLLDRPEVEAELRNTLQTDVFETYIDTFDIASDRWGALKVIVTEYWETWPLREAIHNNTLTRLAAWQVFRDVVIGINELSNQGGACHFNLNPDTVHVRILPDGEVRGVIHGLDAVSSDFCKNADINKSLIYPDCRPPETHFSMFTAVSMEFSLALLLIFMYQRRHPWGITPEMSGFRAYTAMRHNAPRITIEGDLAKVLAKAVSVSPGQRYRTVDEFVSEVMKFSDTEFPASFACFGYSKTDDKTETNHEADDASTDTDFDMIFPQSATLGVQITKQQGAGLAEVAGMDVLKRALKYDYVEIYRHPDLASQYGLRIPSCILFGPPGCGKTFIVKRLAAEMEVDFLSVCPSDLGNVYIHGSQLLIRQLFDKAINQSKKTGRGVLIFFDEIDAMCPKRTVDDNGNQAGEVAEFLTQLNDLADKNVYVVAATNCMERIDPAILRSGRIDRAIYVPVPDGESRKQLFEYELAKRPHAQNIDIARLSTLTDGFTSSDITYIVTECARRKFAEALRESSDQVIPIDQLLIEDVIANTRPSVTKGDLKHYEEMRIKYGSARDAVRRSAGFNI